MSGRCAFSGCLNLPLYQLSIDTTNSDKTQLRLSCAEHVAAIPEQWTGALISFGVSRLTIR